MIESCWGFPDLEMLITSSQADRSGIAGLSCSAGSSAIDRFGEGVFLDLLTILGG